MGNGEGETPLKTPKSSTSQEQPPPNSPATVFPDWASFQAYYNSAGTPPIPPSGFFHSSVASSPQGHPYMWGAQHIMPPYGTPPHPYLTMYPHGGLYAHPTMPPGSHPYNTYAMASPNGTADASVAVTGAAEIEGNSADGKNKNHIKRSKGSLGSLNMLTGKGNETGKPSEPSANGAFSHSAESGSDGSSEGSDANSQNGSQQKTQSEQGTLSAEEVQNGNSTFTSSSGVARNASNQTTLNQSTSIVAIPQGGVPGPTTNLNIGMDYWGAPGSSPMGSIGGKLPSAQANQAIVPAGIVGSRENLPSELWMQDERELKKQRRKQSNRESARRSRLRKQAECEELGRRVETLKEENTSLREELERLREECNKLAAENSYLTERLQKQGDGTGMDGQTESNNS